MTTTIDGDSSNSDVTHIDSASTTAYTTTGENTIRVDTTDAAVTITLASADATRDPEHSVLIYDDGGNASNNAITIDTEGSETISPGGASSKSITTDHAAFAFEANGTNWNQVNANQEVETMAAGEASITSGLTTPRASETISSGAIAYSAPFIEVFGEGDANDDLTEITGGSDGDRVILNRGGNDITVKDISTTGVNLSLDGSADFTMDSALEMVGFIYNTKFDRWVEFTRMVES